MPAACPHTTTGRYGTYAWPCILATGHPGGCEPQIDAHHYPAPLDNLPAASLVSELRLLLHRYEADRAAWAQAADAARSRLSDAICLLEKATSGRRKTVPVAEVQAALDAALGL